MSPRKFLTAFVVPSIILAASTANAASTRSGNQSLPKSAQSSSLYESVSNRGADDDREFHNNGKGHESHGKGRGRGHDKGRGHGHDHDDSPGC